MTAAPLISIPLCAFNGGRYLAAQLESLLAQTYSNIEIVAVDDASTDDSLEILRAYARRDSRLFVHRNATNLGFAGNFERAIGLCRGPLLAFSDQDDVWHPDKLTRLAARRGDAALVYCDSLLIDQDGRSLGKRVSDQLRMYRGSDSRVFAFYNCISGHALLATRPLVESALPFPVGHFHDWWLALVAAATSRIEYLDEPLVQFRQHPQSVTDLSSSRPRAYGRVQLELITRQSSWLAAIGRLPAHPHSEFFAELRTLWHAWQHSYLTPKLALFLRRNRNILLSIPGSGASWPLSRGWSLMWGLKTRQLTQSNRYYAPAAGSPGWR